LKKTKAGKPVFLFGKHKKTPQRSIVWYNSKKAPIPPKKKAQRSNDLFGIRHRLFMALNLSIP